VTTQSLIKSKPYLVRNALRAFVEAIHFYKTRRKEALAILKKYLRDVEPEALEETYEAIGLALIPEKPYPTLRGIQIMLKELATKDPKARIARPEQFVDTSFLKGLDSSGFIDRLYKSTAVAAAREEARPAPSASAGPKDKVSPVRAKIKPAVVLPAAKPASTGARASSLPQAYTARPGDTLSRLARQFYGSTHKWPKIYQANAKTVKNPNYIYIGQELLIPADDAAGR